LGVSKNDSPFGKFTDNHQFIIQDVTLNMPLHYTTLWIIWHLSDPFLNLALCERLCLCEGCTTKTWPALLSTSRHAPIMWPSFSGGDNVVGGSVHFRHWWGWHIHPSWRRCKYSFLIVLTPLFPILIYTCFFAGAEVGVHCWDMLWNYTYRDHVHTHLLTAITNASGLAPFFALFFSWESFRMSQLAFGGRHITPFMPVFCCQYFSIT